MSNLSTGERLILVKHINALLQPDFETLMFALNVPNSVIPSGQAAQGNRAYALLQWVESPNGCGMSELLKTLEAIAPPPFNVRAERKTIQDISPKNFQEQLPNSVLLDMIYIPEGLFYMGSPESEVERKDTEGPQHRVKVPDFFMGKYPVTQAQWYAVALLDDVDRVLNPNPSKFKGDNRLPVERVSWHDAVEFCKRLSVYTRKDYQLPSEAEWEYACRAGTETAYSFGNSITKDQVNCKHRGLFGIDVSVGKTTPVGNYPANKFGLHDMHGNVWEWCQDVWHKNYEGAPTDGSAWIEGGDSKRRIRRGGSWVINPRDCRSADRLYNNPGDRDYYIGFRVVCRAPRALL